MYHLYVNYVGVYSHPINEKQSKGTITLQLIASYDQQHPVGSIKEPEHQIDIA